MRTAEQRVEELHRRMDALKRARARRKYVAVCAAACAACLILAVALAPFASQTPVRYTDAVNGGVTASVFADHAPLGYVLVAVVALCLGALVTVLCFRLKRRMNEDKPDDREH